MQKSKVKNSQDMWNHLIASFAFIVFVALISQPCHSARKSYTGYSVLRCLPQTANQLEHLNSMNNYEHLHNGVQFWNDPTVVNRSVDLMVNPNVELDLHKYLNSAQVSCEKTIRDVDEAISKTLRSPDINSWMPNNHRQLVNDTYRGGVLRNSERFHRQFHNYQTIESKLRDLAEFDPRIRLETIGYSYEKRKIYLVKVSKDSTSNKPVVFIDAGHHAREWVSHSTALYLIESLVNIDIPKLMPRDCRTSVCRDAVLQRTKLDLDNYDYWFLPVVNPDGYEHTHNQDRLWRKTRSRNSGICFALTGVGRGDGVDPNRNYPFHWMEAGASSFACSETFAGPKPLSEPETATLARVLMENKDRIVMYVSFHSFSQLILAPYGYGRVYPDNYDELKRVADSWIQSVAKLRGTDYEFGTSAIKLYPAAGGSDDFAHGSAGIKLAYTIELPDRGARGFLLPPEEIIPVGQEALHGLRAMTDAALKQ